MTMPSLQQTVSLLSALVQVSHRKILMCPLVRTGLITRNLQSSRQVRPYHRDVVRKPCNCLEELLQPPYVSQYLTTQPQHAQDLPQTR